MPFERRLERIEVKGGQPVIQEVLTSRHGTVFNSLVRQPRAGEAYLCYDAQTMDAGTSARMMLEVMDAGDWDEFRHAIAHYYYPGLHIVYADAGRQPRLPDGGAPSAHAALTPPRVGGLDRAGGGKGRIPLDELPHMLNPDAGYISHANNAPGRDRGIPTISGPRHRRDRRHRPFAAAAAVPRGRSEVLRRRLRARRCTATT